MIIKKRKILIRDVTYSNQANTVFGRRKMTRQANMKMLTAVLVSYRYQEQGNNPVTYGKRLKGMSHWTNILPRYERSLLLQKQ
jgi:hypothetical protein